MTHSIVIERPIKARSTDPDTSHQAADALSQERVSFIQHEILSVLHGKPEGLTNHELCWATGITWNTLTPRLRPLVRKGLVEDSGLRRKGPAGRNCIVWKVKIQANQTIN